MAEDWAADVRKYVADADDKVIAAIVRYCGIALRNRDSSLVSFTDPAETGRVRDNFLKKKLGLTHADEELDQAIASVGERMKGANFKNRVTVYYLLLEHFGLQHLFGGAPAKAAGASGAAALGGAAAAGLAGLAAGTGSSTGAAEPAPAPEPVAAVPLTAPPASAAPQTAYAAPEPGDRERGAGGFGWWPWLLLALLALVLLWWLFLRQPAGPEAGPAVAPVNDMAVVDNGMGAAPDGNAVDLATAPAEGTVAIPTGAGVTVETRDGKPVAKVYFDTGKADVVPAFAATAAGLQGWLASHEGATLAVSGFNDPTGNAAANAELSKNRAQAVKAALVAAGIADSAVELVKPEETTDATTTDANARRVEVVVR